MEYKSNINIVSNIFNRKSSYIQHDPDFVHNCSGIKALRELRPQVFGVTSPAKLTRVQEEEIEKGTRCSLARDGQMTHGAVKRGDDIVFECRCEYKSCTEFNICMPKPIIRTKETTEELGMSDNSAPLKYTWLGSIENIFDIPEITELEQDVEELVPEEFAKSFVAISEEYVPLEKSELNTIVHADINSCILVNAGPGTGKTHTVIERLEYIINSGEIDLGQVLVLFYTKAALDVVLKRLDEKGLSVEARQLVICTLDSLAWNKNDDGLFALGYNACIERFNAEFDSEEWSDFEYVIIDELQDIINERAKMTLNILGALQCGYMLLGDKCQAIYDYDCDGAEKINSFKFYEMIDKLISDDILKYELVGNQRQSIDLARNSDNLRQVLLTFNIEEVNDYFKHEIQNMPSNSFSTNNFTSLPPNTTTAILTRNNGEAEWISTKLRQKNIPHDLFRSVVPHLSLHRWIADMFWDYRLPRISREDFIERYLIRIGADEQIAQNMYDAIIESLSLFFEKEIEDSYFNLNDLYRTLKKGRDIFSPVLLNNPIGSLTVSTIHKAKGREFDHVYLLSDFSPNESNTEEARIWYVGATRPKNTLHKVNKGSWYLKKPPTARWIYQGVARYKRTKFCDKIVVGLPDDIDADSFIYGNLEEALQIQAYIASQVKINDTVEFCLINGVYEIHHKGFCIGNLSDSAKANISSSIKSLFSWSDIPPNLSDVYVSNIVTIALNRSLSGADAMFTDSKFWLGIELAGFAKTHWK